MQNNEGRFPIFQERFLKERQRRKLSQADFAVFLGISRPTVGFYENGERLPDALTLRKIAEKCEVTSDYLLGLSLSRKPENTNIGKRLGLSDNAIRVLELYNGECNGEILIPTINLLIEQATPVPFFGNWIYSYPEGATEDEMRIIDQLEEKKYQELEDDWASHNYIDLLSSIEDYLTIDSTDNELIDISKSGKLDKRSTLPPHHIRLGTIKSLPSKKIIDNIFLMDIQEKAMKLKEKLEQSKEENTQKEGENNGDSSEEKGQL